MDLRLFDYCSIGSCENGISNPYDDAISHREIVHLILIYGRFYTSVILF